MNEPFTARYRALKEKHPDALLIFRFGQLYELYGEDAVRAGRTLGLIVQREFGATGEDASKAGFPRRCLDTHLPKLIRAGFRVAICDPLEGFRVSVNDPTADGGEEDEL